MPSLPPRTTSLTDHDQDESHDDCLLSDDPSLYPSAPNEPNSIRNHNPFFFGQPTDKLEPYQMKSILHILITPSANTDPAASSDMTTRSNGSIAPQP